MAEFRQGRPRDRLSAYLRAIYGHGGENRDKRLARDLRVSDRQARNLFAGHWPGDETWAALVRRFGKELLRVVFEPEIAPALAELLEREARLARELRAVQARRHEVAGVGEPPSFVLAGRPDQAAPLEPGPPNRDLFEESPT